MMLRNFIYKDYPGYKLSDLPARKILHIEKQMEQELPVAQVSQRNLEFKIGCSWLPSIPCEYLGAHAASQWAT